MVLFVDGEVVVLLLPNGSVRPALVVAAPDKHHRILCQITAHDYGHRSKLIAKDDFSKKGLSTIGYVQLSRVFTVSVAQIQKSVGRLTDDKTHEIKVGLRQVFYG